jgi:chlorobactene glucosyltransferase
MPVLLSGAIWFGLVSFLLLRALRQFRAFRGAILPRSSEGAGSAVVSVVVPVRNEIRNIGRCLSGLANQTGLREGYSIIVVDDDSQDGTAAEVRRHALREPRIKLVAAGALPEGWVGKPHACWRGAASAEGDWLCFVDADVRAEPELIASALAAAVTQKIDLLSLQPFQELGSLWEWLVMPPGLLLIACAKRFRPASEDIANGQFLLIRREAYFQIGGHAAVRAEISEDKALAGLVNRVGLNFRTLAAEHLARTRMYRDFGSLWEGLSKNATEILDGVGPTLFAAAAALVIGWATLLLPLVACIAAARDPSLPAALGAALAVAGSAVVFGVQLGTARHYRIPACFGLLFAIGYTLAAGIACRGALAQLNGRVTWKGRTYSPRMTSPQRR